MLLVNITSLNNDNFSSFVENGVSLVDIYADWCQPCKILSPVIDELSSEFKGVKFGKLDADTNNDTVKELGVRNIPTILIYKDGIVVEKTVGMISKSQLSDLINNHI